MRFLKQFGRPNFFVPLLLLLSLPFGYQNCAKQSFSAVAAKATVAVASCSGSQSVDVVNKVLFVMDTTGSNSTGVIPSDPGKKWRLAVIESFLSLYKSNAKVYYGLISFAFGSTTAKTIRIFVPTSTLPSLHENT